MPELSFCGKGDDPQFPKQQQANCETDEYDWYEGDAKCDYK